VNGDICGPCCGEEREKTIDCPLDCEFLAEARRHEKPNHPDAATVPNTDIRVTESFLRENQPLMAMIAAFLLEGAFTVPGVVDYDLREALEAMIKTRRTLTSGLIYESRPANPLAAGVQQIFEQRLEAWRAEMTQRAGMNVVRDTEILGILAFFQRFEYSHNNQRRRGRAFIDFLRGFLPPQPAPAASNLIVP
jgi:hypothetical protein